MEIEKLKRLPFVVKAYQVIYSNDSTCEICGLPWAVCKARCVNLSDTIGTFSLCEHCWNQATLEEVLFAHTKTYLNQYHSLPKEERERFVKERSLEYVLQCVDNEYKETNKQQ